MASEAKIDYLSELQQVDWDFDGQKGTAGLYGYHWYPARFVPQIPGVLIGHLSSPGDVVLDPFCGSGTTLVEARRLGRSSVGVDINPVAAIIAGAKLATFDCGRWDELVGALQARVLTRLTESDRADASSERSLEAAVPNLQEQRLWYHPVTLRELACIWTEINSESDAGDPVFEAAFSAILRFACSQDRHWGWICDNVKPRELRYRPAVSLFFEQLHVYRRARMEAVAFTAEATAESSGANLKSELHVGPCADVLGALEEASIDLVVTSPPYLSMTDYVRSQRLTFLWFDYSLSAFKATESGARYKRHRIRARAEYLDEMAESFGAVARVLKPGKPLAVVIGESPRRPTHLDELRDRIAGAGFSIEKRLRRRVATQRTFSELKHEEIVIARRKE